MYPLDSDLKGWLESPALGALVEERVSVRGWVFSPGRRLTAARVRIGRREYPLACGLHRADVEAHITDPGAAASGFEGFVTLDSRGPRWLDFDIRGTFDDGTTRRCFAGAMRQAGQSVPGSTTYWRTAAGRAFDALRHRRLSLSPRRWSESLRRLSREFELEVRRQQAAAAGGHSPSNLKALLTKGSLARLQAFLDAGQSLDLRPRATPRVSVILVLFNRAELTLDCLRSLCEERGVPFEVVLVDNASTDRTSELLSRLEGATIVRNAENLGFLRAVNVAAARASAPTLLLLNNDATVLPGSVAAALASLESAPDIGAVGAKLILPDGTLQEAGSIVWRDGSCLGYGRGGDPAAAEFNFLRDVDFCSGAFLLTRSHLFARLGGFDERFAPAYYEDSDYCVRLWQQGYRTLYDPRVAVMHFEFASSSSQEAAVRMQAERQQLFARTHVEWLSRQQPPRVELILAARSRRRGGHRLLVIDDQVPHPRTGFGFPRAVTLVMTLVNLGHHVTLYATNPRREEWPAVYADISREVEVITTRTPRELPAFVVERDGYYDCLIVSRSHNMRLLQERRAAGAADRFPPVIYDAEAITATREVQRRRLLGEALSDQDEERLVAAEVALARPAQVVFAVSEHERRKFLAAGVPRVERLGHAIEPSPTMTPHDGRRGILFVGAFHELSPNGDSVQWFLEHVWPRLASQLGNDAPFFVIGPDPPSALLRAAGANVHVLGAVADLAPYYSKCRLFVAPTRFAAGIPFKVHHAAAHGLPVVCSTLLAEQLGWRSGTDLLASDSPGGFARHCADLYRDSDLWHRIREAALERVRTDCSQRTFRQTLQRVVEEAATAESAAATASEGLP